MPRGCMEVTCYTAGEPPTNADGSPYRGASVRARATGPPAPTAAGSGVPGAPGPGRVEHEAVLRFIPEGNEEGAL